MASLLFNVQAEAHQSLQAEPDQSDKSACRQ
jgi:hypothetical protein